MLDNYHIQLEQFQGPIELLLSLVEKRKLPINDISLAQVADDYIAVLNRSEKMPYHHVTHFVLTASVLILLKSKSLLPNLILTPEEESNVADLQDRLQRYQIYQACAKELSSRWGNSTLQRRPYQAPQPVFSPDPGMTVANISMAISEMLLRQEVHERPTPTAVTPTVDIDEMISAIQNRMSQAMDASFAELTKHGRHDFADEREWRTHKVTVVVSFLAMLELVRSGLVSILQSESFSDITISRRDKVVGREVEY